MSEFSFYKGTTVAILAVGQRILSYNNCRGIQLLQSGNFSWLLHLPRKIELAGSSSPGHFLLTGEAQFRRCYKLNHTFDTCWGIFDPFTATERGF